MQMRQLILLVSTGLLATPCLSVEMWGSTWKGTGEAGYVATSGNTDTSNLTLKLGLLNEQEKWRHDLQLEGLKSEDEGDTTAERYFASWQSDYKFSEHDYFFGRLSYEDDKFSGYNYRITETLGYGRRVLDRDNMTLDLEAGPGLRQSELDSGESENELIFRVAANYAWQVSDNARFTQELSSDVGEDATITKSVTAIQADIVGNLAMKASFMVKHTSEVPAGVDKTDTETGLTLVYGF